MDTKRHKYSWLWVILMSILSAAGILLLYIGFFTPPVGVISASVLIAFGECAIFASTIMWIEYYYSRDKFKK